LVALLPEPPVERCDACDGLHRRPFHQVGFEESRRLLVGHPAPGHNSPSGPWTVAGVFLGDIQSRYKGANVMV